MQPPSPKPLPARALSALRRQSPWLLALLLLVAYPHLRGLLTNYVADHAAPADQATAAAQVGAQWVALTGPASKLLLAVLAFCVALGVVWLALGFVVPVLAGWAKGDHAADPSNPATDFKHTFLQLPAQWQILLFCVIWLSLLGCFALCWLGASLVQ